ncbi:MAG: exosome complex exonuclease Rrp41 [Candidatus Aenigmatarchaeota archaeon]|nr:MAG: exosome complex exonuclease Rrp41 [Candidatus Aenigmarchaeota archaeon]
MAREDGRKADDLRPLVVKAGVIPNANGSAYVSLGKTTAVAAVYGPRPMHPKHMQVSDRAYLKTVYNMVPFSTKERVRPGPSRRSKEICKVTRQALEPAIFLDKFPKTRIDVYIDIIQANAGTRTAGINAASVALADAGIPMRGLIASVAAGKIGDEYTLDLAGKEEEATDCDLPIAYMPEEEKITLMQLDGDISPEDTKNVVKLAIEGCKKIYAAQRKALEDRWVPEVKK